MTWTPWPPDDGGHHTVTGRILHRAAVEAPGLAPRDVWVCLPRDYDASDARYPVLYAQDGQNLFDAAIAFGGTEWRIDETLHAEAGRADAIVVGIANTGHTRIDEYGPGTDARLGGGLGETYLDFLVDTLKPRIDESFRTRPGRPDTFLVGSSMGGLIALHGVLTRPHVFGGCAALSPSLWFGHRAILDLVEATPYMGARIYLDTGTREGPGQLLDVARARDAFLARGYRRGEDLMVVVETDGRHTESAWARRFPAALRFLLRAPDPDVRPVGATRKAARPTRAAPRTRHRRD